MNQIDLVVDFLTTFKAEVAQEKIFDSWKDGVKFGREDAIERVLIFIRSLK
jgi:hypothetical protein